MSCKHCDYMAAGHENLTNHMYDNHAEIVMIHTMAKQVDDMSESWVGFEKFKVELGNSLKMFLDTQNAMQ